MSMPHKTIVTFLLAFITANAFGQLCPIKLLGSADIDESAWDVVVNGEVAYVAADNAGLIVMNVSDPKAPVVQRAITNLPGSPLGLFMVGDRLYVAATSAGLLVFDISQPDDPVLLGSYDTPDDCRGVHVSGNLAFLADGGVGGVRIVDVTDASDIRFVGSFDTSGRPWGGIVERDGFVYVADGDTGLLVLDAADPANPTLASTYPTGETVTQLVLDGNLVFATSGDSVFAINVSDPSNPTLASEIVSDGIFARSVVVVEDTLYVAMDSNGLFVYDISDVSNPSLMGNRDTSGRTYSLDVVGRYVYVADFDRRVQILDVKLLPADLTGDSVLDFFDISAFLTYFQIGNPLADFTDDGNLDFFDVSAFLNAFNAGCP